MIKSGKALTKMTKLKNIESLKVDKNIFEKDPKKWVPMIAQHYNIKWKAGNPEQQLKLANFLAEDNIQDDEDFYTAAHVTWALENLKTTQ